MSNFDNPFNLTPPPGGQPRQPEWCFRRQFALLLILIGLALLIWSLDAA